MNTDQASQCDDYQPNPDYLEDGNACENCGCGPHEHAAGLSMKTETLAYFEIEGGKDEDLNIHIEAGGRGYLLIKQDKDWIAIPKDRLREIGQKLVDLSNF